MQAIEKESSAFRECYFWLEKSMSGDFFSDVGFEDIILITHNLIGLHLQNYESHINLKDGAIVLCLEDPQSDVRILEKYKLYGIKYYCTYRSHEAPPIEGADKKLCIVILQFSGIREQGELSFSEEDKKKLKLHIRERNKAVTDEEFEKARDKILMGTERRTLVMTEQEKESTAYHEAGHAIVGYLSEEHDPIHKVTIIPRGRALGVTQF